MAGPALFLAGAGRGEKGHSIAEWTFREEAQGKQKSSFEMALNGFCNEREG